MYLQAPRRFNDSYKCGARPRKRDNRTRKFVCIQYSFFRLHISTRLFNFNCVNRFLIAYLRKSLLICFSVDLMISVGLPYWPSVSNEDTVPS